MSLDLTSLVRLDIRADGRSGRLAILEANPKPDLTRPGPGAAAATSLIAAGLPALGWSYDDLVAFLLAERLWQLQSRRPAAVAHFMPAALAPEALFAVLPPRVRAALAPPEEPAAAGLDGCSASMAESCMSGLSDYEAFLVQSGEGDVLDVSEDSALVRKGGSAPGVTMGVGSAAAVRRLRSMLSGTSLVRPKAAPGAPRAGGSYVGGRAPSDDLRAGSFMGGSFMALSVTCGAAAGQAEP
jgi:hypothetical protein